MITKSKPSVLVTYIESGFGHIMSAQAIASGLKARYADMLDIVEAEIMRDDNDQALIKCEQFLTKQTKATNKYPGYGDFVFALMDIGKTQFMKFVHHTLFQKAIESAIEAFHIRNPDVIISTHYFVTFCAMEYKRKYKADVVVVTYNPDNNVHVWWDKRCDVFITNNNRASTEAIRKRKFDYSHVRQVYFTAREEVKNFSLTREQCREKYNIPKDKFCIMIADGGYAGGKAQHYCEWIAKHEKLSLTIIFLAGKNKKLFDKFSALAPKLPKNITLMPFEFTEQVYELYAAADLFVTKAGPNSVLDSLFVGTPVMIDNCPHPIERATYRLFVKSYGCGVGAFNRYKASRLITKYIGNPALLEDFHKNMAENIDKNKDGAAQIADIVYEQLKDKIADIQADKSPAPAEN